MLPVNNTSVENLAGYLVDDLRARFEARFPDVPLLSLRVAVEETSGQRGACTWLRKDA